MVTIIRTGGETLVEISRKEYRAFQIIKEYRELRLPPRELQKELKKNELTSNEISAGLRAINLEKKGARVSIKGNKTQETFFQSDSVSRRKFDMD